EPGEAANRLAVTRSAMDLRADALIGIAAYRTAAARIKAPVGRHFLQVCANNRAERHAPGRDEGAGAVERLIGRAFGLQLHEGRAVEQIVARLHISQCPEALGRIQLVVAVVE